MHVLTESGTVEANLRQSFRVLALGRPRGCVTELDGVTIASLGATFQMFNAAFLSRHVSARPELEIRFARAREHFDRWQLPWAFWICENWLAWSARRALVGVCEDFGLRAAAEMPGMAADFIQEPKRFQPWAHRVPRLEILRANTSPAMHDFRAVGSVCFHVPLPWFSEAFDDSIPDREFKCWVGYVDSRPVATAATIVSDGAIGLYNVATLPDERGRGYAEAITRHAIAAASRESGLDRVILQSTVQGQRLYRRLGFREVSRVVVFNSVGGV